MAKKARIAAIRKPVGKVAGPVEEIAPAGLPFYARIVLVLAILVGSAYVLRLWLMPIRSWDLWFHMKTGEYIFTHHTVPHGDIFSAKHLGREWIVNAWIAEILLWAAWAIRGATGVMVLQLLISYAMFAVIGFFAWRISGRPTLSILMAFLAAAASYYRFNARPELFTLLMMVVTLAILYQYKFRNSDRIVWLIPLSALWANLHMGFTAAVAILGSFVIGDALMAAWYSRNRGPIPEGIVAGPRLKKLCWVSVAALAATLINPYGPNAWLFLQKLTSQFESIAEWLPLLTVYKGIDPVPWGCILGLAAITVVTLYLSRRPQDLVGLLLASAFAYSTFRFNRQLAQFVIVVPFVAAAASRGLRFPRFLAMLAVRMPAPRRAGVGAVSLLVLELAFCGIFVGLRHPAGPAESPFGFGVDKTQYSTRAMSFVRDSGLIGSRLYNSLELGGWIIWNLWPKQPVFIDGRLDMYGKEIFNQYFTIASAADCSQRLKELGIDYCVFRYPEGPETNSDNPYHAKTLARDPDWALVFFDDGAMVYARREPKNAGIISRYEYQVLSPLVSSGAQFANPAAVASRVQLETDRLAKECPDSARAHLTAGIALRLVGRPKEAVARLELAREYASRWDPVRKGSLEEELARAALAMNDIHATIRHLLEAIRLVAQARDGVDRASPLRVTLAACLATSGRASEALQQLEAAALRNPAMVSGVLGNREFDSLRSDPRFQALMSR